MKTMTTVTFVAASFLSATATAEPVTESQVWSEIYAVTTASPRLSVSNIWGNVRVRPGPDGEISVTIEETRYAPDQAMFERSKELLDLDVYADANGASFQVGEEMRNWRDRDHCSGCRVDYQFEIRVPKGALVDVATVTDGRVDVEGINGRVSASNVNGPVSVAGLHDCESVESVNGRVDVAFELAPGQNCAINTINGDVTLSMPPGTGMDIALDIFNGRVTSEFDTDTFAVPAQVEYEESQGKHRYRIQQLAGLRIEGGGPTFSISSLNGDVRIQEN